jgi:hypothetical protein
MLRRYHLFQPLPAAACDKADRKIAGLIISNLPEAGVRRNVPGGNLHLPISRFRRTLQNLEKAPYGEDGLLRFVSKHNFRIPPTDRMRCRRSQQVSVGMSAIGTKRASIPGPNVSALGAKADMSDAVT